MLDAQKTTVRKLARLLGTMVASLTLAPLYYRHPERAKTRALQRSLPYKTEIQLDHNSRSDVK